VNNSVPTVWGVNNFDGVGCEQFRYHGTYPVPVRYLGTYPVPTYLWQLFTGSVPFRVYPRGHACGNRTLQESPGHHLRGSCKKDRCPT